MPKAKSLIGKTFGRLKVAYRNRHGFMCYCKCGRSIILHRSNLLTGTKSCGCLRKEAREKGLNYRHGFAPKINRSPEYAIWNTMRARCHNPKTSSYPNYGGRGISVCKRWRKSFVNFINDMGRRPSDKYTLDRIDNDGNYEPGNVRWATWHQQRMNQRRSKSSCSKSKSKSHRRRLSRLTGKTRGNS